MKQTIELKSVQLYTEKNDRGGLDYFLDVTYFETNEHRVVEINYPKVKLPFCTQPRVNHDYSMYGIQSSTIDLGFGQLPLLEGGVVNAMLTKKVIETFPRKMTLAEIEEKLGYKVELVSEKEEKTND